MEKVCPWCGQPSDQGRLKNRTELMLHTQEKSDFPWVDLNPPPLNAKQLLVRTLGKAARLAHMCLYIICVTIFELHDLQTKYSVCQFTFTLFGSSSTPNVTVR